MTRAFAVARRILSQFRRDPRTLAIMFLAPCVVLWLFSILLDVPAFQPVVALQGDDDLAAYLEDAGCTIADLEGAQASEALSQQRVDAIVSANGDSVNVQVEGTDCNRTAATLSAVRAACSARWQDGAMGMIARYEDAFSAVPAAALPADAGLPGAGEAAFGDISVTYLHGNEEWGAFELYGPVYIGVFVFAFVFVTSIMSLLTERSGGTLSRLLATPAKGWHLTVGYVLGFGALATVQACIVLACCIYVVGFPNAGSLALVVLVVVLTALASLALGICVSGLAKSMLQVVQLVVLFVAPQILLSGVFDLSRTPQWMQTLSQCFPLTHGVGALQDVMLRGAGIADVAHPLALLAGFTVLFCALACATMRRKRA